MTTEKLLLCGRAADLTGIVGMGRRTRPFGSSRDTQSNDGQYGEGGPEAHRDFLKEVHNHAVDGHKGHYGVACNA
jgi:hypothetical protein